MSASLGVGVVLQQRVRRQQHAGRAVAALQAVLIPEPLLERVQRAALRQPLDREDLVAVGLHREHRAGLHRALAVHDDDAAAAARRVAADVRAGQPAVFAQEVREQRARLDVPLVADAVDLDVIFMPAPPAAPAPDAAPGATSTPARCFLYSTLPRRSACGSLRCRAASAAARNQLRAWVSGRRAGARPRPRARRRPRGRQRHARRCGSCRRRPATPARPRRRSRSRPPCARPSGTSRPCDRRAPETPRPAPSRLRRPRSRSCRRGNRRSGPWRVPSLPRTTTSAREASATAVQSPAGSLWHRLPTTVPICRTTGSATTRDVSWIRLQRRSADPAAHARCRASRAIAPTASTPSLDAHVAQIGQRVDVDQHRRDAPAGTASPESGSGRRPARGPRRRAAADDANASSAVWARRYSKAAGITSPTSRPAASPWRWPHGVARVILRKRDSIYSTVPLSWHRSLMVSDALRMVSGSGSRGGRLDAHGDAEAAAAARRRAARPARRSGRSATPASTMCSSCSGASTRRRWRRSTGCRSATP